MNLSELKQLIEQPNVQAQIKAEIGAAEINRQMLTLYLQHLDADDCDFEGFRNLIRLVIGISYDEKFNILKSVDCDGSDLNKINDLVETFESNLEDQKYKNRSSMISHNALQAINIKKNSIKDDEDFLYFAGVFVDFCQRLISDEIFSTKRARNLYLNYFRDDFEFPQNITIKTLGSVLYALKPEAFPLINGYVTNPLESVINKLDLKSAQDYIEAANTLDVLLNVLDTPKHFGVIDRVMAITSAAGGTIDISEVLSQPVTNVSGYGKNQILYGAAGTGKTYHTINRALEILDSEFLDQLKLNKSKDCAKREQIKAYFDELVEKNLIHFVTFHQSFSYEDFVEGIGVKLQDREADQLGYEVKAGIFKQICEAAQQDSAQPYVLIIDEINRGNISRIFGELITLLEDSKRACEDEALSVTLPYSKEKFSVPSNLYIIGTMNSSDRSLTGLDIALRRRFSFIEMQPDPKVLAGIEVDGVKIDLLLETINKRIEVLLDRDHCIGHAYFMPLEQDSSIEKLAEIFAQKILPLLQEYFYDDWERIDWVLNCNDMLKEKYNKKGELEKLFHEKAHGKVQNHNWYIDADELKKIIAYQKIIGSDS